MIENSGGYGKPLEIREFFGPFAAERKVASHGSIGEPDNTNGIFDRMDKREIDGRIVMETWKMVGGAERRPEQQTKARAHERIEQQ